MNSESSSQLLEIILSEMKNKSSTHVVVDKNYSFTDCENIRYKLWNEFRVEINEERKKILLSIWRK